MEQRIARIEKDVAEISKSLTEFANFVKQQFERQEKILETMSHDIGDIRVRINKIEETLYGIEQAFLFKTF
jgi:uncharacterized coiled-coil protein SlyX